MRKRARIWMGGAIGVLALASAAGYFYCRPKVSLASLSELQKEAPPELLLSAPYDPAASARYSKLVEYGDELSLPPEGELTSDQSKAAIRVSSNQPYLSAVRRLLAEGPIRGRLEGDIGHPPASFRNLARAFSEEATLAGMSGDKKGCAEALRSNLGLARRLSNAGGSLTDYLVMVAIDKIGIASTMSCVQNGWLNSADLKEMIRDVPLDSPGDPALAKAYAQDFQDLLRKMASSPLRLQDELNGGTRKSDHWEGSFDAQATASLAGRVVEEQYENALREWPKHDKRDEQLLETVSKGLPTDPAAAGTDDASSEPAPRASWWSETMYHLKMNLTPNSIGRSYAALWLFNDLARESSVYRACNHELARAVFALRLYQDDRSGSLPQSLEQLVRLGYLKSVPMDWFVCQPLHYDSRKGIVYSVGLDMTDNGGKFERQGQTLQADFGYFLTHRTPSPSGAKSSFITS